MPSRGVPRQGYRGRFRREDRVTVACVPGVWKVAQPAPQSGHYLLLPADPDAKGLANLLPYGMLDSPAKEMTPKANPEQETLI
jgi:hypothetical protein